MNNKQNLLVFLSVSALGLVLCLFCFQELAASPFQESGSATTSPSQTQSAPLQADQTAEPEESQSQKQNSKQSQSQKQNSKQSQSPKLNFKSKRHPNNHSNQISMTTIFPKLGNGLGSIGLIRLRFGFVWTDRQL